MSKFQTNFLLPLTFVLLYGNGFVATKYGLENISPMAFLLVRFFIAFILLLCISYYLKVSWPKNIKEYIHIIIAGVLTVAVFSIGVYVSIDLGVSPSLNALIIALQPTFVSILAMKLLSERISKRHWFGLVIGFMGVTLVVMSKFDYSYNYGIIMSIFALAGLSFGNLYQKKYCSNMNLFSGGAIQTLASALLVLPLMFVYEDVRFNFNIDLVYAILYMSVAVSIGALSLLYIMIEKGEISKVSSMFYLIPVCAVVMSYLFFDEDIDLRVLAGIVAVLMGMALMNKKGKSRE
ncbi:DMT family transporter [Arcobacter sp. HD9-500m-PIT-SAG02]|nr:DMT family transporter [Arcobacter sp. HD9-500m-PIT-SAG02]